MWKIRNWRLWRDYPSCRKVIYYYKNKIKKIIFRLTKKGDVLQQNIKDYELKIDNLKLAIRNIHINYPGIKTNWIILSNNIDPQELEFKISQLNDQKFKEEQTIESKKYENSIIYKNIQEIKVS